MATELAQSQVKLLSEFKALQTRIQLLRQRGGEDEELERGLVDMLNTADQQHIPSGLLREAIVKGLLEARTGIELPSSWAKSQHTPSAQPEAPDETILQAVVAAYRKFYEAGQVGDNRAQLEAQYDVVDAMKKAEKAGFSFDQIMEGIQAGNNTQETKNAPQVITVAKPAHTMPGKNDKPKVIIEAYKMAQPLLQRNAEIYAPPNYMAVKEESLPLEPRWIANSEENTFLPLFNAHNSLTRIRAGSGADEAAVKRAELNFAGELEALKKKNFSEEYLLAAIEKNTKKEHVGVGR